MDENLFRKKSMDRISSPEELGAYLRVTNPAVWMILTAVILLLVGFLVWGSIASIDSFATGKAVVNDGSMVIHFDDETIAENVTTGMTVLVGDSETTVSSMGRDADGRLFAVANTSLTNGNYEARVVFRRTQVLSLLFN